MIQPYKPVVLRTVATVRSHNPRTRPNASCRSVTALSSPVPVVRSNTATQRVPSNNSSTLRMSSVSGVAVSYTHLDVYKRQC